MKILLVDDEMELTETLSQILNRENYQVDVADNGENGLKLALENDYDLLILDWMLPKISGLEICQQIRQKSFNTPVLFLTAKDTIDDRVLGLDVGADDYIVKPFELRELLARVRALLRRNNNLETNSSSQRLKVGDLELDIENQVAYRKDKIIKLSKKEIKLLQYFMFNAGKLLTHEEIYQHLWEESEQPSSNVVAAFIRLLRRKIEVKKDQPIIQTVYGKGYRFEVK